MRVFCPEHHRGFLAPRQNPIKCGNRGHILGELDFEGEAKPPAEIRWRYCCNCEHFYPTGFGQDGIERCPVCGRQSSALYLCDRCYTISFESNTSVQTKNFTLTSAGAPEPSCPGCLRLASADLREHTCDELGASLITALSSCPVCQERLDIGPSFPASVAYYLKRTRAGNKLNVTFDYESELFVLVEDGEFVLVRNGNETAQPIVLPRSSRFATRRHFYDFYQDCYHCANPGAGEVQIIQAAAVDPVAGGWKLKEPGILEVLEEQPKKKGSAVVTRHQADTSTHEKAGPSVEATKQELPLAPCAHCGSLVETRYAFCWHCGDPLTLKNEPSVKRSENPMAIMLSAAIATEDEEPTTQHHVAHASSPMFSWALQKESDGPPSESRAVLKLIALALLCLVLVSLGLFVALPWALRAGPTTAVQITHQETQGSSGPAPGRETERNLATESVRLTSTTRPEDDELKNLRKRRIAAGVADLSAILKAFASAEKQYPNDYRFPYERAKLAVKGDKTHSHGEAFATLSLAAEKAIDSGKAREMLESLEADKDGDFHKLSHGHGQWNLLEQALKNKAKRMLEG